MSIICGRLLLIGVIASILPGCHSVEAQRRSIDELVEQALADAAMRGHLAIPERGDPAIDLMAHHAAVGTSAPAPGLPISVPSPQSPDAVSQNLPPAGAQHLVSDYFQDIDIREAIQILAAQANVSVIIDEQVVGTTSAVIEKEPFETALRRILLPLRCVYCWRDGQCVVGVPEPESALFSLIAERIDYQPLHLSPTELLESVPERYRQYLRLVDKRNRVLIEAPAEIAAELLNELQRADQPVPQVVLETMVCVLSPEARLRFGLDLEQGVPVGGGARHGLGLSNLALTGAVSPVTLAGMFSDFAVTSYFLQALAQEGYVKIRATPRVMAKDGEKAQITIARESFFSIQPNAEILFRQDIQRVEAGITLDILPVVRGDTVTVVIEKAEVSEDIRRTDNGVEPNSQFPLINRRWVSTTVHVKDGQTIVIGGLTQNQVIDRISRIPYLGKLPWVGGLFTRVEKEEQEAEIVIFLSPRIVRAPPAISAAVPPAATEQQEFAPEPIPLPTQAPPEPVIPPGPVMVPPQLSESPVPPSLSEQWLSGLRARWAALSAGLDDFNRRLAVLTDRYTVPIGPAELSAVHDAGLRHCRELQGQLETLLSEGKALNALLANRAAERQLRHLESVSHLEPQDAARPGDGSRTAPVPVTSAAVTEPRTATRPVIAVACVLLTLGALAAAWLRRKKAGRLG